MKNILSIVVTDGGIFINHDTPARERLMS
jgi:hypothetical protein